MIFVTVLLPFTESLAQQRQTNRLTDKHLWQNYFRYFQAMQSAILWMSINKREKTK